MVKLYISETLSNTQLPSCVLMCVGVCVSYIVTDKLLLCPGLTGVETSLCYGSVGCTVIRLD